MKANGTYNKNGTVAELWGGPTDQNAFWFKSGNDAVLNPLFAKRHDRRRARSSSSPTGMRTTRRPSSSRCSSRRTTRSTACIAANDNIAGAVIADLKAKGLKPIPLSGQDATAQGVQYILAGWQTGTVYKYVPTEANAAAAAAVALIKGMKPKTNTFRLNGKVKEADDHASRRRGSRRRTTRSSSRRAS